MAGMIMATRMFLLVRRSSRPAYLTTIIRYSNGMIVTLMYSNAFQNSFEDRSVLVNSRK